MMKKILSAGAVWALALGHAYAQSSVTLSGIVEDGLNYVSNSGGKRLYNVSSGELYGSQWSLRGVEDLGADAKAIFVLNGGFDENAGKLAQGGLLFGRQAYVGLSSQAGTLTLGRQYDSVVDYVDPFSAASTWGGTFFSHAGDVDQIGHTNRTNNAVKYTSREFHGTSFDAMYSFGGIAGSMSRNQIASVGVGYTQGAFKFGAAYLNVRDPNVSFWGSTGSPAATVDGVPGANFAGSPAVSGFASAHTQQVIAAGASYRFDKLTVMGNYSNASFLSLGNTSDGAVPQGGIHGHASFNTGEIGLYYPARPDLQFNAIYFATKTSGVSGYTGALYQQGGLGVDYFLSKRTTVYVTGIYQKSSGTDSTGHAAVATIDTLTASDSNGQAVVRVGIQTRF